MSLSTASQPVIVCSDSRHDQTDLSVKLAKHYQHVLSCQLVQLEQMIERENPSSVVVLWRQPTAELRLIVEFCNDKKIPLLVIIKQLNPIDINRLPASNDVVIIPFDASLNLKPWIDYSIQVRAKGVEVQQEIQQLTFKLDERKWIEKAKGLLMRLHSLDEDKAYQVLRSSAMQSSLSIAQVAKNVIHTFDSVKCH